MAYIPVALYGGFGLGPGLYRLSRGPFFRVELNANHPAQGAVVKN
jgi:hypothetical protein